jgi:hypothetical protein
MQQQSSRKDFGDGWLLFVTRSFNYTKKKWLQGAVASITATTMTTLVCLWVYLSQGA